MAIYPQIEKILQDEVDRYNLDESRKKKAEVGVKESKSGPGNNPYGMRSIYNVFLSRLVPESERVLSVSHDSGDAYFPPSAIIRVHFSQEKHRDEAAVSPERLAERLRVILAAEEWDAKE
jgi:hypothetical protein